MNLESIKRATADYYGISKADLVSPRRDRFLAHPRQLAMYLAMQHTDKSAMQIGAAFGERDHTTVLHARKAVQARMDEDLRHDLQKVTDASIGFVFRTTRKPPVFKSTRTQGETA